MKRILCSVTVLILLFSFGGPDILAQEVMSQLKKREFRNLWYVKQLSYDPEE